MQKNSIKMIDSKETILKEIVTENEKYQTMKIKQNNWTAESQRETIINIVSSIQDYNFI